MALDRSNTRPKLDGLARIDKAAARRNKMTEVAVSRPLRHVASNAEELTYSVSQPTNFTKGLAHDAYGLVERSEYEAYVADLISPNPKMDSATKVGKGDPNYRKWESPLAGHYFEIEGPDPAQFTMSPAPKLGGSELCFEMASVYVMALLRDVHFGDLDNPSYDTGLTYPAGHPRAATTATMQDIVDELNKLSWADKGRKTYGFYPEGLTAHEKRRRAALCDESGVLTVATLFRGSTTGAKQGPYLSQFMLLGTPDRSGNMAGVRNSVITFGAQTIDQRILRNSKNVDYMQSWEEWLEVQNGEEKEFAAPDWNALGLLQTPRDLATYVHYDQLFQAYLNAGMMLDVHGAQVDEGTPIFETRGNSTKGFATWGGPHMLSLVTEVATRALRAVRRQKFQIHRRARPEVLAARLTQVHAGEVGSMDKAAVTKFRSMLDELGANDSADVSRPGVLLHWINEHNERNGGAIKIDGNNHPNGNFLLPMAFPEGSPMHPAYGAGHATVAGACVTILKAFYRSDLKMKELFGLDHFYEANANANGLRQAGLLGNDVLVSEELDKLAANIAIGRNFAGVHYYTDYYDSLRLGERIAAGILEEQMLTYNEPVKLSFRDFDGDRVEIAYTGEENDKPVLSYFGQGNWWLRPVEGFYQTQSTAV